MPIDAPFVPGIATFDPPTATRPTAVRWHMLGLIVAASALSYVLRTNLSIAGPSMKTELGLSEVQLGFVLSAFVTTYALFQIPGALLGERFGARLALTWLYLGWGVVTILMGLVPGRAHAPLWLMLGLLVALRGLLGAFQPPLYPVSTGGTVARWLPPTRWGLANALQNVGFTLASAASAPVGVWLVLRFGWRASIVVAGPLALGLAALWWWYNRDDPKDHWRVNSAELELIGRLETPEGTSSGRGWTSVFTNRDLVLVTLSYFLINYLSYLFFNWFYYYLTEVRPVSPQLAGYFAGGSGCWVQQPQPPAACSAIACRFASVVSADVVGRRWAAFCWPRRASCWGPRRPTPLRWSSCFRSALRPRNSWMLPTLSSRGRCNDR